MFVNQHVCCVLFKKTSAALLFVNKELKFMLDLFFEWGHSFKGKYIKTKKVGSATYLLSLKLTNLTNLTKPKLMKKNVLQMYSLEF